MAHENAALRAATLDGSRVLLRFGILGQIYRAHFDFTPTSTWCHGVKLVVLPACNARLRYQRSRLLALACLHDGPCCNELLLASPIVEVLSLQASSADTWTILNCSAFSAACDLRGGTLDPLLSLLEEDFNAQLADNPEFSSQCGIHTHSSALQDLSPEAFERRAERSAQLLARLLAIPTARLDSTGLRLRKMAMEDARGEAEAIRLGCHLFPINSIGIGGVHHNFIETLQWMPPHDHEGFLLRLEAFPAQCEQFVSLLATGASRGLVASRAMLRLAPEQAAALAPPPPPLLSRLRALPSHLLPRGHEAEAAFVAAVGRLAAALEAYRKTHARPQPGVGALPRGTEIYAQCLRFHTTSALMPEEIHAMGLEEVLRIEERMAREVFAPLGFEGEGASLAFREACAAPQHYFSSADALLDAYRQLCARIEAELPRFFHAASRPGAPLEVVSKESPSSPAAYYLAGTPDGSRPGRFYVNVAEFERRPKYEMTALALHEANPGHHLQLSLALEDEKLPSFVRYVEDRRYEFCPARRQLYAAYIEGWALYCEALGEEMGLYATPFDLFGRLSMEMMRAVRLVVDTGIHAKGWSVERAIQYMHAHTGMHERECEAECYRYEAWPGQACAYKIGEMALRDARESSEGALGEKFDVRDFHAAVLRTGPVPLDMLEEAVVEWVAWAAAH
ncbi:hypothetical protein AB1Y20_008502 [Prymnesium parvum]|uniref:DUF885 domain-containing protein n=1 Tax=Prymnesium parvum TaxID=97485 RepID=A0AB34ISN0_PRYPA